MNILVLGAGMVGRAMALDLSSNHSVTSADINEKNLQSLKAKNDRIESMTLDVSSQEMLKKAVMSFDLVVNAVPGFLGFNTLKSIIKCRKNVVDISFFPEDGLQLYDLAKENQVTALIDCGVAPGMDNLILGYEDSRMKVTDFECLVGGLPKLKKWPFAYKAPFSPVDVIEEYTRPARYVENSNMIVRPALTDCELVEFDRVGTLESFNSDGLRSIIHTMKHIPNMKEKTLRYPGHVEYIRVLRESGFFDTENINVSGMDISPLEFTSKILFKEWQLGENEEEITVMSVKVCGTNESNIEEEVTYYLHDEYDKESGISSMARTTGYTATACVNMLDKDLFENQGVFPLELVGSDKKCFDFIMNYQKECGIIYRKETVLL
ncbi:MAG: saccharopine dehydrogenase NADP-binding domain-containing protein [Cyclobacteriaceae bacterium]